jgi:superfamily II DNA or RNA helicase
VTTPFAAGDLVRARHRCWRLEQVEDHGTCASLHLAPADGLPPAGRCVLIHPIDEVTPVAPPGRPAVVSRRAFWHRTAARLLALTPFDTLVAPVTARLDLLPYQLEPALSVTCGGWRRVLLADAVGLGKTVQAGLVLAELFARARISRAVVLVPAALVSQWTAELRQRFSLDATAVDHPRLRELAADLPGTVNPWLVPTLAVVSIDFAKRPEVRAGLADAAWDAVVIDEAHTLTADSDRCRAAGHLARRAPYVILATATPHSGNEVAFATLARLGAVAPDEPMALFRRSRAQAGFRVDRRSTCLRVRPAPAERRALRLLMAYARLLWNGPGADGREAARLVATVLIKRACSSPGSLRRSILRRRAVLAGLTSGVPAQLALPLDDDEDPADAEPGDPLGAPGLADGAAELAWLDTLASAAAEAACGHRKRHAIVRYLRRAGQPVIVFTEYRDTLDEVFRTLCLTHRCVVLHGGLTPAERETSLEAFAAGRADVLLATDAAGTGLNLHARCRAVVDLEMPWNPVRLEQRAGRVDRIGQCRRVHVVHMVGHGTPEERVLARLAARARRARAALADEDAAMVPPAEDEVAEAMLGLRPHGSVWNHHAQPGHAPRSVPGMERCGLEAQASAAAASLSARRRLRARLTDRAAPPRLDAPGEYLACARTRARGATSGAGRAPGILVIGEVRLSTPEGALVDETLVACHIDAGTGSCTARPQAPRAVLDGVRRAAGPVLAAAARERQAAVRAAAAEGEPRTLVRLRALAGRSGPPEDGAVQAGLFDQRSERGAQISNDGNRPGPRSPLDTTGEATARLVGMLVVTNAGPPAGETR